jgi:hypothetical protein
MMGELKFFLGFQIKQLKEGTFLCQTKNVNEMLKRFDMADSKPIKTPMALNGHLDLNEEGKSVDQKVFDSMIGSLLYLCASRPDIVNTKNWYRKGTDLWAEFGDEIPFGRKNLLGGFGKDACSRQCVIVWQKDCLRFYRKFSEIRDDVARI